jgi:hypothetical protein
MLSMSAIERQGQMELNIGKVFINTRRVNSAKFEYEAHFMSFGYRCFQKWDRGLKLPYLKHL